MLQTISSKAELDGILAVPDLRSVPRVRGISDDPVIDILRRSLSLDHVWVCGLDLDGYRVGSFASVSSDLPPMFLEIYGSEKLYRQDPMVVCASLGKALVTEDEAYLAARPGPRLAYLLDMFSLANRVSVFLRNGNTVYGLVGLSRRQPLSQDELSYFEMIAEGLHRRVSKPLMDRFAISSFRLSGGEVECLRLAGQGLTSEEIAERSNYQRDTVDTYLKTAIRKLRAKNRAHAIAEALRYKLIE